MLGGMLGSMLGGIRGGLVFGPLSGLVFSLVFGLASFLEGNELQDSVFPNEGIRRSIVSAVRVVLPCGLLGGLVFGPLVGLVFGLVFGLLGGMLGGLLVGLRFGGFAALQHIALRILLAHRCHAPWNFATCLDEAVSRSLMTRVGGGYRFYHRQLQEYFTTHEQPTLPVAPMLGPQEGEEAIGRRSQQNL